MALTKVTGHVVKPDTNIQFHNTKSTGIVTFTHTSNATSSTTGALQVTGGVGIVKDLHVGGNVTVGGTLTYDDVTNIDSLGIITARGGINVSGGTLTVANNTDLNGDLDVDGHTELDNVNIAGVSTFNDDVTFIDGYGNSNHVVYDKSQTALTFPSGKNTGTEFPAIIFGDTTSGGNTKLYNDYYNTHFKHIGAGNFVISSTSNHIQIAGSNGSGAVQTSIYIPSGATAGVKLYQANQPRFETVGYGVTVLGTTETQKLNVTGISTFSGGAGAITIAADSDIRFTNTSNWSGEHAGKIQYFGNKLYLQGGSNGHQLRNHSGGTVFEIGSTGSCAGMDLTLAQDVTLNGDIDVDGHTELDNLGVAGVSTFSNDVSIICTGDANLNLVADTGNNNESSVPTINFTQDGGVNVFKVGVEGTAGETFTGSTDNTPYLITTTGHGGMSLDFGTNNALRMKLTATGLQPATNNVEYLGTNTTRWARLYTNGIYEGNVKRFEVTSSGFEGYGTQFKFSDVADVNVIINADTDNNDESHAPNLAFTQDGTVNVLNVGVEGNAGDKFTGSTGNFAYVQVGGHSNSGLEIAIQGSKRLTIDHNGHIVPATDGNYNIGSNLLRFANIYSDALHGAWTGGTVTNPVIIDINGTDDGEDTLLTLDKYVSDLSNEYTWIDFTFRDSNANSTPQVKVGAQVMDDSSTGQQGEGAGDFVVKCAVDTASNTMTEMFRCSHDTKITSVHHYPQSHESFDLGTETSRWRQVYATDFRAPDGNTNGLYAGNSYDLHLFHNGSHSFIENDTGNLTFTNKNNDNIIFKTTSSETERIRITKDGDLYAGNADTGGYAFFDNSTLRPRYQFRQGTGTNRGFAMIETRGDANGMDVFIAKSREGNGTGLINAGDQLGRIRFAGADGNNMINGAEIFAYTQSTKTCATDRMPTNLSFRTHDDNTAGTQERMRIWHDGRIGISKNGWAGSDNSFAFTVHTGSTSDSGAAVNDGIMIVSQNSNGNQNSTTGKIMWCGHAQTNGPFIYAKNAQAYGKKDLVFHTRSTANDYTTQVAETFRLTYQGNVGINEPAPDTQLFVRATSDDNPSIKLYRNSGGGDTASINWASSVGTNAQINYRGGSGDEGLQFRTATSAGNTGSIRERFRVNTGSYQGVQVFVMDDSTNGPTGDKTAITIQNGIGGGDIGPNSLPTHIDWRWIDSNSNVTPQCRISGHVGDGGDPNSHQKEGKGFLTFHCSNTGNISGVEDPAEVMRLNHLGDLCLNQITNDTRLGIKQRSSTVDFITCRDTSSTLKFYVHSSGNTYNTNGNYSQISDQSLKENIVDAKSQWNDIKNIKIRNFNFTKASGYETHTQIGCVAQEVETVSPKLVTAPRADGIKTVSNSVLYMKAVKALQEAMTRIETLEAEVASLKGS